MPAVSGVGKLNASECALFVCDVQESYRHNKINGMPAVIDTARRMVRAADAFNMPILVSEHLQYPPEQQDATVREVAEVLPQRLLLGGAALRKDTYSMWGPEAEKLLAGHPSITKVLLCGIEAHVCVLQTALDLIERGYEVHVLLDGVSSQRLSDRAAALQRLAQSGAFLGSSEMVMYQMLVQDSHPAYQAITALANEPRPDALPSVFTT